jgi:adenylosuccinate lyase
MKGISKLEVNATAINDDLDHSWEVLAEAIQTVMRRYAVEKPYEKLKDLTRGRDVTRETFSQFILTLDIPEPEKRRLLDLTPARYIGNARDQALQIISTIKSG